MVATVTRLTSASTAVDYYEAEGYYAKNDPRHRQASSWYGKGAAALGLPLRVSTRRFNRILSGHVPGMDIRLGRARDGEHEHAPGLDLTLSAPKSVSLEALLHGERRVGTAHDAAVRATLDWVETELLQTRAWDPTTRRHRRVEAHGLVAATFRHLTSRDQDPQLHTHCIVANMTRDQTGAWRSIETTEIRRAERLIGAFYRHELACRLQAMGYAIEPTMIGGVPGFEIAGYPRAMLDAFSSRRREILAWLDAHGLPWSAALTRQAALITRKRKTGRGVDELRAGWKQRMAALGLARDRSVARPGRTPARRRPGRPWRRTVAQLRANPPGPSTREVVWRAVEHLSERATAIRAVDIRAIALGHVPGRHSLADIDAAIAALAADAHLVETTIGGARAYVTGEALRSERTVLAHMRRGRDAAEPLAPADRVSARLNATTFTRGQREAVRTILLSRDRVVAIQGAAGSGKTSMLREALRLMGERRAVLLAPSSAAVQVLAGETGAQARTLQWFLTRYGDLGDAARVERAAQEYRGRVLVLDEASMVSTAQMERLMLICERLGIARLVLVGDRGQLKAVSAGEPFRMLQQAGVATARMEEIRRQRDPALRTVVEHLRDQRPADALRGLDAVHEVAHDQLGAEAARLWLALEPELRATTLIVAPTHFIRAEIHRVLRDGLAHEGVLHGREIEIERYVNRHLTAAQRAEVRNHEPGDIVVFHSRVPPLRVEEGDACRVVGTEEETVVLEHPSGRTVRIRPGDSWVRYRFGLYESALIRIRAGDRIRWTRNDKRRELVNGGQAEVLALGTRRIRLRLDDGRELALDLGDAQLRHIEHAWSSTVHAAQGQTRDRVIGVLDTGHAGLTGQAGLYVEASRARDRFVLVTDDREQLEEVLEARDGASMSALEAIGETPEQAPGSREIAMLEALEADWRRLPGPMPVPTPEYARIVTAVMQLSEGVELPDRLARFVREVRERDAALVARRRQRLSFLGRAERHRREWPLLRRAAAHGRRALAALPAHRTWSSEGERLLEEGRRLAAEHAQGAGTATIRRGISTALRALAHSRSLDLAARSTAGRDAPAHSPGPAPRRTAGDSATRPREPDPSAGGRDAAGSRSRQDGPDPGAGRVAEFLRDAAAHLAAGADTGSGEPDSWRRRARELRSEGRAMLGERTGARLDDPARVRLAHAHDERRRVRDALEALNLDTVRRDAEAFRALHAQVRALAGDADPADAEHWPELVDRAHALRGVSYISPEIAETARYVLDHDARIRADIRPVTRLIEEARHSLGAGDRSVRQPREQGAGSGEEVEKLHLAAGRMLAGSSDSPAEVRAGTRIARMPRLRERLHRTAGELETHITRTLTVEFLQLTQALEDRAGRAGILPRGVEGYERSLDLARRLERRTLAPGDRDAVRAWLGRETAWCTGLERALERVDTDWSASDPDARRADASLPVVADAIRSETARLAAPGRSGRTIAWSGDAPLVPGDRIRFAAGALDAVVVAAGAGSGTLPDDRLELRPVTSTGPHDPVLVRQAGALGAGERAAWSDERLRLLALARLMSAPSQACRMACDNPVPGDLLTWTEPAGPGGAVRTIEAVVHARDHSTGTDRLRLRIEHAEGPGAPAAGSEIARATAAVLARGCFRAKRSSQEEYRRTLLLRDNPRFRPQVRQRNEASDPSRSVRIGPRP
ncbi:MAG: relaxase domain-containing protein [Alphaproteobacteria bacterium]|nr:relaxase domain-containing protein [Alphaproteobacteria bacterium]